MPDRLAQLDETLRQLHAQYELALQAGHEGELLFIEALIDRLSAERVRESQ